MMHKQQEKKMETLKAILTRRSVRKFKDQKVEPEKIDILLKAAMHAPSARNTQPWHFIVVDDRAMLDKIAEVHPYAQMCKEAPLAIIPCADTSVKEGYWMLDVANATENLLLAARDLDLGAVWLGVYSDAQRIKDISELFNLPENITPICVVPVGYSDMEQGEVSGRYQKDKIHHNSW